MPAPKSKASKAATPPSVKPAASVRQAEAPLFMWAGGKRRLLKHYAPLWPNPAQVSAYVEPFAGGAAVFAHLRRTGLTAQGTAHVPGNPGAHLPAALGDTNAELIGLYTVVRDRPAELLAAILPYEKQWAGQDKAARKTLYYAWRQQYWELPNGTPQEQLAATALLYMLMKTGFNGIWQTCEASRGRFGTPVGLANQTGPVVDPVVVRQWSAMLANTELHAGSYATIPVPHGAFVYCDPPYRDSFTHYSTGWQDEDLAKLIAWCRHQAKANGCLVWLANRLSDPDDGYFDRHAADAHRTVIPVVYTAGRRKATEEGFQAKAAHEVLLIWDGRHTPVAPAGKNTKAV
jgi:DNA adenine methylase